MELPPNLSHNSGLLYDAAVVPVGADQKQHIEYARDIAGKFNNQFGEQFKLPKDFMLELSAWYNGPSYVGTKKTDGFGAVNAGIKKDFPNNGGTLQLSVADIFKTVNITSRYGTLTREAFDVKSHVVFTAESGKAQIFKLTYSKSFGGGSSRNRRSSGSDDERDRVRKY